MTAKTKAPGGDAEDLFTLKIELCLLRARSLSAITAAFDASGRLR